MPRTYTPIEVLLSSTFKSDLLSISNYVVNSLDQKHFFHIVT